jgi:hypothetical protein
LQLTHALTRTHKQLIHSLSNRVADNKKRTLLLLGIGLDWIGSWLMVCSVLFFVLLLLIAISFIETSKQKAKNN